MDKRDWQKLMLAPKLALLCLSALMPLLGQLEAQANGAAVVSQIEKFKESDTRARIQAVKALKQEGVSVVPTLVLALSDSDPGIRQGAALVLGSLGAVAEPAVPALVAALGDEDDQVRLDVAVALRRIGSPGAAALTVALQSEDVLVRRGAALALAGVAGTPEMVGVLIKALADADEVVRLNGAVALRAAGSVAIPALRQALLDENPLVRAGAAFALGKNGLAASGQRGSGAIRPQERDRFSDNLREKIAPEANIFASGSGPDVPTPTPSGPSPSPSAPSPTPSSGEFGFGGTMRGLL